MLLCSPLSRLHRPPSSFGDLRAFAPITGHQRHQSSPWLEPPPSACDSRLLASTFVQQPLVANRGSFPVQRSLHSAAVKAPARGVARAFFSRNKAGSMADGGGSATSQSKVVVVTGATKGLGRALVLELAKRGHRVAGCGRDVKQVEVVRQLLDDTRPPAAAAAAAASPAQHLMVAVDVASDGEVKAFAQNVISTLGVPDIVVNCAGLINANKRLWEVPCEEVDRVLDVNIKGTVNVIRHFAPTIVDRRNGVFVNFSSGWGRSVAAEVGPYCASKWAVEGLSKSLALELPAGCVSVALNPGVINTAMLHSCFGSSASMYQTPEECVGVNGGALRIAEVLPRHLSARLPCAYLLRPYPKPPSSHRAPPPLHFLERQPLLSPNFSRSSLPALLPIALLLPLPLPLAQQQEFPNQLLHPSTSYHLQTCSYALRPFFLSSQPSSDHQDKVGEKLSELNLPGLDPLAPRIPTAVNGKASDAPCPRAGDEDEEGDDDDDDDDDDGDDGDDDDDGDGYGHEEEAGDDDGDGDDGDDGGDDDADGEGGEEGGEEEGNGQEGEGDEEDGDEDVEEEGDGEDGDGNGENGDGNGENGDEEEQGDEGDDDGDEGDDDDEVDADDDDDDGDDGGDGDGDEDDDDDDDDDDEDAPAPKKARH
ncbi:unnamed protein product [Closterium sp. Naga37s-1]|nr:unnamed protein product [Closterium sp. Naga37s-1]